MTEINTTESNPTSAPHGFVPYTAVPQVEALLEEHLGDRAKLLMPEQWRENFVKGFPWIALMFTPFHFAAVIFLFGVTALASLVGHFSWGGALLSGAVLVCDAIALPGLFKRTRSGWAFLLYAQVIGVVSDLLSFSMFGLLIGTAILWIAFQVKYKYT